MQSLDDDERRDVLGEVLFDELKAILEYVQRIPFIEKKVDELDLRLTRVERIVEAHELDLRLIRQKLAI